MRRIWLHLPVLLLLPMVAVAQPPAPAPPAANPAQMLNFVLQNWEKSMTQLQHFSTSCARTTVDKTFGGVEVYEGWAKYAKSAQPSQPSRAILQMTSKRDPAKYEKFLYTGTYLYEYVPTNKVLRIHDVPPPKAGQLGVEDNILSLLFGMTSAAAQQRYQMTWVPDTQHNNKFYHYLRIVPRTAQDKADFTEARLTLTAKGFLPRQVWYHQPNGNEITWDFTNVDVTSAIPLTTFAPPQQLEKGWRTERVPSQQQPAIQPVGVAPKK